MKDFLEKFGIGFAGGFVPQLLIFAEFLRSNSAFPGWGTGLGDFGSAVIYGVIGGVVSWVSSPEGLEKLRLFLFGLGARWIILATLAHVQGGAAPLTAFAPYHPSTFTIQESSQTTSRCERLLGSLKRGVAPAQSPWAPEALKFCAVYSNGDMAFEPAKIAEDMGVASASKSDIQRFTQALMHGLGLSSGDIRAQVAFSFTLVVLAIWALAWARLLRRKAEVLSRLKAEVSRIDGPAEIGRRGADIPRSLLLSQTDDPLEKGLSALGEQHFDDAIDRFTEAIRGVSDAFFYRGVAHYESRNYDQAVRDWDTFSVLNPSNATSLRNKGVALNALNRSEEAIATYDELLSRFGTATEPALREQVAKALLGKGVALGALNRSKEEIAVYDELLSRFGTATEPALQEQVAKALFNKGITLGTLNRSEEAITVYDELLSRFGTATEPALREQVAKALTNRRGLAS